MRLFRLEVEQILPVDLQSAWTFFSDPDNLSAITPPWLGFGVVRPVRGPIRPDLIIEYRVRPFPLLPVRWVTRIGAVEPPHRFVDEQVAGPYRFWLHEHRFESYDGGTLVRDAVHYALPLGVLGAAVHPFLVRPRLEAIFGYRRAALERHFPRRA